MENLGSDFDLESYIENIDLSQSPTPVWWGTKDQELIKIFNDLDPLPRAPMTSLHNTEASQKTYTKQYDAETPGDKKSRFGDPISDTKLASFAKPFVPVSTQKNTRWCVKVFNDWATERNSHVDVEKVPIGFLERADCASNAAILNKWLTKFVLEGTRRIDRRPYPPDTIYALLCGLYRYMQSLFGEAVPNFLSRKHLAFKELNAATDKHCRELRASGVGTEKKSAQPLTEKK